MKKYDTTVIAIKTMLLLFAALISGCAAKPLGVDDSPLDIGKIRIDAIDKRANISVETISRCSGFILSEKEVRNFLTYAARVKDDGAEKYYRALRCSASGTAVINGQKYNWLIRAGGVGELNAVHGGERLNAVCGKKCCDKVPGIC